MCIEEIKAAMDIYEHYGPCEELLDEGIEGEVDLMLDNVSFKFLLRSLILKALRIGGMHESG